MLRVCDGINTYIVTPSGAGTFDTDGIYVAMLPVTSQTVTIVATTASVNYVYAKSVSLAVNQIYNNLAIPMRVGADLSLITADYTAKDGEMLTGTLANKVKISIADGATVTLNGVSINANGTWGDGEYAGITCLGESTIVLADGTTNTVRGFHSNYPGIYVPSDGKLLIQGTTGQLIASPKNGGGPGADGAGIGGGYLINCGNIEIQGGIITANGGYNCADIGSGGDGSKCGYITITGGTVNATGGAGAAGIGSGRSISSGYESSCLDVIITTGVTSVTATKGEGSPNSIGAGAGDASSCSWVAIGCSSFNVEGKPIDGTVYWDGQSYQNGGDTYLTQSTLTYKPQ